MASDKPIVWVAGQCVAGPAWELLGVFSAETSAVSVCATQDDFVGPVPLDTVLPVESVDWPGSYYPLRSGAKEGKNDVE